jgi:eukaryotic-like serine/threonine-protein kinase
LREQSGHVSGNLRLKVEEPNRTESNRRSAPAGAVDAARVGANVGKASYRLTELVGKGGMAEVYAAARLDGSMFAVKILRSEYLVKAKVRDRFLQEATLTRLVDHPAAVRIFEEDYAEDGAPFMVMELLHGKSLQQHWRDQGRRLPIPEALRIAEVVLACMNACHAAGVVHRDLKPANVFLTDSGAVRVLDFGIAAFFGAKAEEVRAKADDLLKLDRDLGVGTPAYMSPEQARFLPTDARSDLFSIGAMLHALITGHRLHASKNERESLLFAGSRAVPSILHIAPNLPPAVATLIDKSLQWNPEDRYQSASAMLVDVQDALELFGATAPESKAVRPPAISNSAIRVVEGEGEALSNAEHESAAEGDVADATYRPELARDTEGSVISDAALLRRFEADLITVRGFFACIQAALAAPLVSLLEREIESAARVLVQSERDEFVLRLRPYGFALNKEDVWIAEDALVLESLHQAYAQGVRRVCIRTNLLTQELLTWLRLMFDHSNSGMDLTWAAREASLQNITFEWAVPSQGLLTANEGMAAEQANEWLGDYQVEADALRDVRKGRDVAPVPRETLTLFRAERSRLQASAESTYHQLLGRAFYYGLAARDITGIVLALRKAGRRVIRDGAVHRLRTIWSDAAEVVVQMCKSPLQGEQLAGALARALVGGDNFDYLVEHVAAFPQEAPPLVVMCEYLGDEEFLRAIRRLQNELPANLDMLLRRLVTRLVVGKEDKIHAELMRVGFAHQAVRLGELLLLAESDEATRILQLLANESNAPLQVASTVLLASPAERPAHLVKLLTHADAEMRRAALEIIAYYKLGPLAQPVSKMVDASDNVKRADEEVSLAFAVLFQLDRRVAVDLASSIARKGGLFGNAGREQRRILAVRALAQHGLSEEVIHVLNEVAAARWTASPQVRQEAKAGLLALGARTGGA